MTFTRGVILVVCGFGCGSGLTVLAHRQPERLESPSAPASHQVVPPRATAGPEPESEQRDPEEFVARFYSILGVVMPQHACPGSNPTWTIEWLGSFSIGIVEVGDMGGVLWTPGPIIIDQVITGYRTHGTWGGTLFEVDVEYGTLDDERIDALHAVLDELRPW